MHDVACEFACTERCAEIISANGLTVMIVYHNCNIIHTEQGRKVRSFYQRLWCHPLLHRRSHWDLEKHCIWIYRAMCTHTSSAKVRSHVWPRGTRSGMGAWAYRNHQCREENTVSIKVRATQMNSSIGSCWWTGTTLVRRRSDFVGWSG